MPLVEQSILNYWSSPLGIILAIISDNGCLFSWLGRGVQLSSYQIGLSA
jgi:hypothetical protein